MKITEKRILKLFCIILFVTLSENIFAQNTYTEAIERYLNDMGAIGKIDNEQMRNGLINYTDGRRENGDMEIDNAISSAEVVAKYMEEQITTDYFLTIEPYFHQEGITIEQLNELSDLLETEAGKTAVAHKHMFSSETNAAGLNAELQRDIMKLMKGQKIADKKVFVSKEREKLFSTYYKNSSTQQLINSLLDAYSTLYQLDPNALKKIRKYYNKNFEKMALAYSDVLTDQDLIFLNNLSKNPFYKKVNASLQSIINDNLSIAIEIVGRYETWLEGQYQ